MATKHLKNLSQFEEIAKKKLDQEVSDYFFKGSNYSLGLKRNTESLQRLNFYYCIKYFFHFSMKYSPLEFFCALMFV